VSTVHLLIGPDAGRGRAEGVAAKVEETIRAAGHDPIDITGSTAALSRRAAEEVVERGTERMIVVGGDGMVHLALQAVAESDTVLGVVPVGTGNDFARAFGVPATAPVDEATRRALDAPRIIDAIQSDRGWVASVATAGFSGDVNVRANALRWPKGPKRYTVATLLEIPRLRSRHVRLIVDGQAHDLDIALLAVANTAWFGGGMHICPDARADDGQLDVTVVRSIGRVALLRYFPMVFSGSHLDHPKTSTYRGRTVSIECDELDFWGDGETLGAGPITFTAAAGAIRLAL
jgi:diacylglycerol kinase (ATP)